MPGSSDVFDRGFVTYSNAAKTDLLGVDPALIVAHGAVSEEVAQAMAAGALKNSTAAATVSVTGVAGPGGTDLKPEGMVCFATATKSRVYSETIRFGALGRSNVRQASVQHALSMLIDALCRAQFQNRTRKCPADLRLPLFSASCVLHLNAKQKRRGRWLGLIPPG